MDAANLPERYNAGLIPPPEMSAEAERLPYPAWRPTAAQVEAARKNLRRDLAILIFLVFVGLLAVALLLGWRP